MRNVTGNLTGATYNTLEDPVQNGRPPKKVGQKTKKYKFVRKIS